MAEFTSANPFTPKATVIRYHNSTFEARIHLPGAAAHVDVVPHENFILVTGSLAPRIRIDAEGRPSTLLFTDQPCGVFGRDIPINLTAGTELVVLATYQDCDDYVIRYTLRNTIVPRANCADVANATAATATTARGGCPCPPGLKGSCGRGAATGIVNTTSPIVGGCASAIPPALLNRGPHTAFANTGYGYGHAHLYGYGYGAYGHGYGHGFPFPHATSGSCGNYALSHPVLHPNGGSTSA